MSQHRVWVYGDNINTDVIFPGKYTYTLKTPEDIAAHALEDLDATFATNVKQGDVIVAGKNWGCGSSREQAVTTLKYSGVYAVIAASFGGIFFRNCINQGIVPIVCDQLRNVVQAGDTITLDLENAQIIANGQTFAIPRLSPSVQAIMDTGGLVPMLRRRFAEVAE
jgi:3-isopropylmalate/(R)-2-methylmalate dehydratase small subunit